MFRSILKKPGLQASVIFSAALVLLLVLATDTYAKPGPRGPRSEEHRQKMLERFDTDGNGTLDQDERAKAQAARKARQQKNKGQKGGQKAGKGKQGQKGGQGRKPQRPDFGKIFDRLDANNDGAISREEFKKIVPLMRQLHSKGKHHGPHHGHPGYHGKKGGPGNGPQGTGPRGNGPRGNGPQGFRPRGNGPRGNGPQGPGPRGNGPRGNGPGPATSQEKPAI